MISTSESDRMEEEELHSLAKKKDIYHIFLLCMKFMVSTGANSTASNFNLR